MGDPTTNVERLVRGFAGWGRDEPAGLHELLASDCELVVPASIPYGGTFRGAEAAIGWFTRELWRWFDAFSSTPEGLVDGGDRIAVEVHVRARARNGRELDVHNAWVYDFRDGRLVRAQVFADTAVLRDAVEGVTPAP
jgi:ketosteroid isomerase-like protein